MADQFDISPEKRKLLEENAKRKLLLRNEFLKQASNPFQHATSQGGTVFDPAIQRYNSMRISSFEFFRPSPKNGLQGLLLTVIPIVGYAYYLRTSRNAKEAKFRSGQVAYKDREFKFA